MELCSIGVCQQIHELHLHTQDQTVSKDQSVDPLRSSKQLHVSITASYIPRGYWDV